MGPQGPVLLRLPERQWGASESLPAGLVGNIAGEPTSRSPLMPMTGGSLLLVELLSSAFLRRFNVILWILRKLSCGCSRKVVTPAGTIHRAGCLIPQGGCQMA